MTEMPKSDLQNVPVTWSKTFAYALFGVRHSFVHERNMRVHMTLSTLSLLFCLVVRPPLGLVALACVMCFIVFAAETFNTSVEALTDLVTKGQPHRLAKVAKDAAAGAVLLTAASALCVAYYLIAATYPWHFLLFTTVHAVGAILVLMVIIGTLFLYWSSFKVIGTDAEDDDSLRRRRPADQPQRGNTTWFGDDDNGGQSGL